MENIFPQIGVKCFTPKFSVSHFPDLHIRRLSPETVAGSPRRSWPVAGVVAGIWPVAGVIARIFRRSPEAIAGIEYVDNSVSMLLENIFHLPTKRRKIIVLENVFRKNILHGKYFTV